MTVRLCKRRHSMSSVIATTVITITISSITVIIITVVIIDGTRRRDIDEGHQRTQHCGAHSLRHHQPHSSFTTGTIISSSTSSIISTIIIGSRRSVIGRQGESSGDFLRGVLQRRDHGRQERGLQQRGGQRSTTHARPERDHIQRHQATQTLDRVLQRLPIVRVAATSIVTTTASIRIGSIAVAGMNVRKTGQRGFEHR